MTDESQRPKGRDRVRSALDVAIGGLNLAKEAATIEPAKAAVGSVAVLLTMIRDTMANEKDYVELGLFCVDICKALERGMDGKKLGDLSKSVRDAMDQLTTTVKEIEEKVKEQTRRGRFFRFLLSGADKDAITGWKSDLNRILIVFNTELIVNTHTIVADIQHNMLRTAKGKKGTGAPRRSLSAFMFFCHDWRERIKAENPDAGFGELGRLMGAKWKGMNEEEKKPYIDQAAADKVRAEKEKEALTSKREKKEESAGSADEEED